MEYQQKKKKKINKIKMKNKKKKKKKMDRLGNKSNQPSKFKTNTWFETNDESCGTCNTNSEIKF